MYFICISNIIHQKTVPTRKLRKALYMTKQVAKVITVYCSPPVDIRLICINSLYQFSSFLKSQIYYSLCVCDFAERCPIRFRLNTGIALLLWFSVLL